MTRLDEIESPCPAGRPRRARCVRRSGAPFIPSCWSWCAAHTLHADLRQQPPAGGAHLRRGQRTGRRDAGARASRQRRRRPAQGNRRPAEDGHAARHRRHLVAGTRHRYGRHRSGGADRSAAFGGQRHAAHRPRQPSRRRRQRRRHFPEIPRRSGGLRRHHARHARRQGGDASTIRAIRSTCWRSRSSPWSRWTPGMRASSSRWSASAAPYAALTRGVFESVLDMLSGRYPSDEFAELRPRITWDRVGATAHRRARAHAAWPSSTAARFPDRGLFGVFLAGATRGARVGELDEEMVFESRTGDTIILGASTWRIEEITHDRVIVSPAPGEPGKMPFWHGDTRRPARRVRPRDRRDDARTARTCRAPSPSPAWWKTTAWMPTPPKICCAIWKIRPPPPAGCRAISDIVIERCRDELGDWRVCVLTPFGSRVHAPWCMAVTARAARRARHGSGDHVVRRRLRDPPARDARSRSKPEWLLPSAAELKDLVLRQLGSTSLFAAKFREAAGRALLLPRRRPGMRAPLWQQRKRAADLLAVAARYSSFPILLETYRECVREVFDLEAAADILQEDRARHDSRHRRRIGQAFALRVGAAVLLHRQLHLRWRCAARRAPRAGALHRSVAARRNSRQHRFPRAAGQSGARRSGGAAAVARPRLPGAARRRRARSAAASSAI